MLSKYLSYSVYDCFTDKRFGGNVGAIVWNAKKLNATQMQNLAKEFNVPVTGFILGINNNQVRARFFMPSAEIGMCGHVTIGIFTHLINNKLINSDKCILEIPSGQIEIITEQTNNDNPLIMFSLTIPKFLNNQINEQEILNALNISSDNISSIPIGSVDAGLKHLFINFKNEKVLRSLKPNFNDLKKISKKLNIDTVACFTLDNSQSDINLKIRDFCPVLGVNETPASGTTNGALTGYLLKNKLIKTVSQRIIAYQGSEIGRPSCIISKIDVHNKEITKLQVGGTAVSSFKGEIEPLENN